MHDLNSIPARHRLILALRFARNTWLAAQPRCLAALFLLSGLLMTAFLSTTVPPFQNPDEVNHFLRASQISDGSLLGYRFDDRSGGLVDTAIVSASTPFASIPFHPEVKVTQAMYDQASEARWGKQRADVAFPNTAVYPPLFYLPSVAAIEIGKLTGARIIPTLYAARALTGISTTIIASIAISIAGGAALWIFAVLALPMATSQMIASSHEGLMIASSAMVVALLAPRLREQLPVSVRSFDTACAITAIVASARPPYAGLALVLLAANNVTWTRRVIGVFAVFLTTLAWAFLAAKYTATLNLRTDIHVDAVAQLKFILDHPLHLARAIGKSIASLWPTYCVTFVGQLGWLDVDMPPAYRTAAFAMLILAAITSSEIESQARFLPALTLLTTLALVITTIGIFVILYLSWNEIGATMVEGVTGRYFIVPALFFVIGLPRIVPAGNWTRLTDAILALFPFLSLIVIMQAVVSRYYAG